MNHSAGGTLAVIVVNFGSSDLLRRTLLPLTAQLEDAVTVVVDSYSTAAERAAIAALAAEAGWSLVTPEENIGFGAGMNAGAERARSLGAATFLLLNPDASIEPDAIARLQARCSDDPFVLAAPTVLRPDGSVWSAGSDLYLADGRIRSARRRGDFPGARREEWLSGACLMLTAALWDAIDGFDPGYFLYWEDVDLSHRVRAAGGRLEVLADATAVHAEGGTQGTDGRQAGAQSAGEPKSSVYYYYNIRNRLLFASRHLPDSDLRAWRRATVRVSWEILLQGGRRQFLRSAAPLVAGWRGVRDGRRLVREELRRRSEQPLVGGQPAVERR
ncbi:glycosyltransferase family 2 protein [Leifsonia sp. LS-T14]|uniref:glycosyltransferase family 2 protein n=1 Tax=unclassified Leifsonia TaxID=2663824 RepID=UPI0035A5A990